MASNLKPLSGQEWETLIDDYNRGRLRRWDSSNYCGLSLLDLALSSLVPRSGGRETPLTLKLHLLLFLEEHSAAFFPLNPGSTLSRLLETLRSVIQSPNDSVSSINFAFKEQFLISATSIFISTIADAGSRQLLQGLVELLLTIVNRPNHALDRQTRAVACECLRELETAFPCLLSEIGSHLWALSQSERTHAAQSYVLLLATVFHDIVMHKVSVSIVNATAPLLPFSVPRFVLTENDGPVSDRQETSENNYKELRRVLAFLLEWPHNLTTWGVLELMDKVMPVAKELDLQVSLLKVQLSGMLYTYEPLLCHAFLGMCLRFFDSFEGQENEIARRLVLLSKQSQQHLVFRLLVLHWLLGFFRLLLKREADRKKQIVKMCPSFYPNIFDPLALKSLKLDLLAFCSLLLGKCTEENGIMGTETEQQHVRAKLLEDGLVSLSSYNWIPPWSTETAVAFRTFYKFLIDGSSHSEPDVPFKRTTLAKSTIFQAIQRMLVEIISESRRLVSVTVAFINRLLRCPNHYLLGECLLETFDQKLLPKLKMDYKLGSYFPLLEKVGESRIVSPNRLLELLTMFMGFLIKQHGPDTVLKSWSEGSKALSLCRTMMIHHSSSKLFLGLSQLLAFTCLYFPDLEVRDNARIYLRMLVCIPGKKLRHILKIGDQYPGVSHPTHSSSFFDLHSSQPSRDRKKSRNVSSYIHLERLVPLLVKQSWSLSLSALGIDAEKISYLESIKNHYHMSELEFEESFSTGMVSEISRIDQPPEPLRVMDTKISEIIKLLRKHFSCIPDFRLMPGLKIKITVILRFESEPFSQIWGVNMPEAKEDGLEAIPAIYATVLKFSSSAPYGSIPPCHIPFLLGQPSNTDLPINQAGSLDIVPLGNGSGEVESFKSFAIVELEPREPIPGLIDVFIETNTDNGQVISGQLQSVTVGIEDMFLRTIIPEDVLIDEVPAYYADLFSALWEACGASSSTGRETFVLKGGKGLASISGTRSVKLLEVPAAVLIQAVERSLAPFVVSVVGQPLVDLVKNRGVIDNITWKEVDVDFEVEHMTTETNSDEGPLYLKYTDEQDDRDSYSRVSKSKRSMGQILVLIFLPPRFHLLFQIEVGDISTLVRIRTDHWPSLAYVDDYLEALFSQ